MPTLLSRFRSIQQQYIWLASPGGKWFEQLTLYERFMFVYAHCLKTI